jgi:succinoglycan biosynthesis protein ExoO
MSPQVSIIVPAFNAQEYIAHALSSALSQTNCNLEVIVVDDGSTDHTFEEVARIAALDERVRLLQHERTCGASATRNTAIAAAQGDWIAPLDADDAYAPNRLDYLLKNARETDADLVADNLMLCSFPARVPLEPAVRPGSRLFEGPLTLSEFVGTESVDGNIDLGFLKPMIRRQFIQQNSLRYRHDLKVVHDFCLYVEAFLRGGRFVLLPEPLYKYSVRPGSLSNCGSKSALAEIDRLNRCLMGSPLIEANPEWRRLFRSRQQGIDRAILYARLTEAVRQKQVSQAFDILCRHPAELAYFTGRLSQAAQRRLLRKPYRPRGGRA